MTGDVTSDRNSVLLRALADRIDRTDASACNNLGVLYYSKGMFAEAVSSFLEALALSPRMAVAARNLAQAAAHPGACAAPRAQLEARLATNPSDGDARRELARLLRLLSQPDDAKTQLDALLAQDPDDVIALQEYGRLEQHSGDLGRAQRWFERALAIDPADHAVRLHLAEVHYHRGANHDALRELTTLLAGDPRMAEAHLLRGYVLGDMGRESEATEATRQAAELDPALATLQPDLALDARFAPGAGGGAVAAPALPVTRGLQQTPMRSGVISNESLARHGLGLAFRQRGYFAEARVEFERALARGEDAQLVHHALAELDLVQGRPADAQLRYERLLETRGDDARLWVEHGVALHQAGKLEAAADSYRRALRSEPRHALAYNNLGVALANLGDQVAAREALQHAAQLSPDLVVARLNLARWHREQHDAVASVAVLRELVTFRPALASAWSALASVLLTTGQHHEALEAATSAVEHAPDDAEARYARADVLGAIGDGDRALEETERALRLSPLRQTPRLAVQIPLQHECPESVGRLDLLALQADAPLAGEAVTSNDVAELLPEVANDSAPDHPAQDPEYAAVLTLQHGADGYAARGLHGEAYDRYQQVRALSQSAPAWSTMPDGARTLRSALLGEIRSACLLGRGADVIGLVDRLGAAESEDVEVLALLAASHAALGDTYGERVARSAIQKLLQRDPRSAALLHFTGDAAAQLGDPGLSIPLYRRALALDPARPSARIAIARVLLASGDTLAAHLELVAALALVPHSREAVLELAALHIAHERADVAIPLLSRHLERAGADVDALAALGLALRAAQRTNDARAAVQRARRFAPDHPEALWLDGLLLSDQGRTRDARSRWGRLIAMAPGSAAATRARDALAAQEAGRPA